MRGAEEPQFQSSAEVEEMRAQLAEEKEQLKRKQAERTVRK